MTKLFSQANFGSLIGCILVFAMLCELKWVREHGVIHGAVEGICVWGFMQYVKYRKSNSEGSSNGSGSPQESSTKV